MQRPFNPLAKLADRQKRRRTIISLTPLIDVVFILLVFFMLASSFLDWRTLALDTSAARQPAPSQQTPFVVQILEDGVALNDEAITLEALIGKARNRQPADQAVSLQPLASIRVQRTVQVLDALNAAGIQPLKLVGDPEWQAEPTQGAGSNN
ncbi:MAG: biopolymer transporter ExbD [Cellvibrionaceae bacterium]